MNYGMKTPCDNCPFRKEGGIRLHPRRAKEIATGDGEFPCHKTTVEDTASEDGGLVATDNSAFCAGFLIFREKLDHPNQMMRVCERLGMYDARALMENNPAVPEVFDSMEELAEANP